jgi:hypothetical protein
MQKPEVYSQMASELGVMPTTVQAVIDSGMGDRIGERHRFIGARPDEYGQAIETWVVSQSTGRQLAIVLYLLDPENRKQYAADWDRHEETADETTPLAEEHGGSD